MILCNRISRPFKSLNGFVEITLLGQDIVGVERREGKDADSVICEHARDSGEYPDK